MAQLLRAVLLLDEPLVQRCLLMLPPAWVGLREGPLERLRGDVRVACGLDPGAEWSSGTLELRLVEAWAEGWLHASSV